MQYIQILIIRTHTCPDWMRFLFLFVPAGWLCQKGRHWWEGDENGQFLAHGTCSSSQLCEVTSWFTLYVKQLIWNCVFRVCCSLGKGSGSKAFQGLSSTVWASLKWIHTDGTHPKQGEPGQSQDGRPGVQRQPLPASVSCEKEKRTGTRQPASQRLQRGEGKSLILVLDQWCADGWWSGEMLSDAAGYRHYFFSKNSSKAPV